MPYRYRPKDNRTPMSHPVIGHLVWDGVYDNPACAGNPDFVEIPDDLDALGRVDLNDAAVQAGVEQPEKLPNKQAVIDAIAAAGDTPDEPDTDPDAGDDNITVADSQTDTGDAGQEHA